MNTFEGVLAMLEYSLDTKKKRHIIGGVLLSVSLFFGGLAITVLTLKNEEDDDNDKYKLE